MHQGFAEQWQNRGIRELEQKEAKGKGKKATVSEENGAADPMRMCRMAIGSTTGPAEVNVARAYPDERQDHRDPQCGGH